MHVIIDGDRLGLFALIRITVGYPFAICNRYSLVHRFDTCAKRLLNGCWINDPFNRFKPNMQVDFILDALNARIGDEFRILLATMPEIDHKLGGEGGTLVACGPRQ